MAEVFLCADWSYLLRLLSLVNKRFFSGLSFLSAGAVKPHCRFVISRLCFFKMKYFLPIVLLTASNVFMMFAWYGHLKFKSASLWIVIVVSWLIAFFEYCLQVPANRMGHQYFSAAQLKTMQEVITLVVFCVFSVLYLKEELKWNYFVGFAFMVLAVFFVFKKW